MRRREGGREGRREGGKERGREEVKDSDGVVYMHGE